MYDSLNGMLCRIPRRVAHLRQVTGTRRIRRVGDESQKLEEDLKKYFKNYNSGVFPDADFGLFLNGFGGVHGFWLVS